jgi:hypothetical protein
MLGLLSGNIRNLRERPGSKSLGRRKTSKKLNQEEREDKRNAILTALTKASNDSQLAESPADTSSLESHDYYTLSRDEVSALVSGNIEILEGWVSNLDRNHATRLLRWLIKEKW